MCCGEMKRPSTASKVAIFKDNFTLSHKKIPHLRNLFQNRSLHLTRMKHLLPRRLNQAQNQGPQHPKNLPRTQSQTHYWRMHWSLQHHHQN